MKLEFLYETIIVLLYTCVKSIYLLKLFPEKVAFHLELFSTLSSFNFVYLSTFCNQLFLGMN